MLSPMLTHEARPVLRLHHDQRVVYRGVVYQTHVSRPCMEEMTDEHRLDESFRCIPSRGLGVWYILCCHFLFFILHESQHSPSSRPSPWNNNKQRSVDIKALSPCFQGTRPDFRVVLHVRKRVRFITPAGRKTFLFPALSLFSVGKNVCCDDRKSCTYLPHNPPSNDSPSVSLFYSLI